MNIEKFNNFRKLVPLTKEWAYFETASTGLIPKFVYDGINNYQYDRYMIGGDSIWRYDDGTTFGTLGMMERSKKALANMINCDKEDIAFGQNSSQLFTLFTEGFDFKTGDNIVLQKGGFISNRFAWQIREKDGLTLKYVEPVNGEVTVESIIDQCDKNTKAVSIAYVESSTGYRVELEKIGEFCRKNGIYLVVDAVQALGVLQIDVQKMKIDFMVGNDYKWMMNYCGTGYAYISPVLRGKLKHWGAGWMTDEERFNTNKEVLKVRVDAGQYELGFPTVSGIYGMGLVAENYNQLNGKEIEDYALNLMDYLYNKIEQINGVNILNIYKKVNRSSICNIIIDKKYGITDEDLKNAKIFAHVRSINVNKELIKVSLHYYNNNDDIDRLCELLKNFQI